MLPLSVHIWVGLGVAMTSISLLWVHVDVIATLNSTISVSFLFVLIFTTTRPTPPLHPSYPPSYVRWPNVDAFCKKNSKTGEN